MCRKCEKNLSDIQPIMQNQTHYEPHIFKGIKFVNNYRKNLCYINATVNAFLNCKSVMNLVQSNFFIFNKIFVIYIFLLNI